MTNFVGVGADFVTFIVCYILFKFLNVLYAAKRKRDAKKDAAVLQQQDADLLQFRRRPHHKPPNSVAIRLRSCSFLALPTLLKGVFKRSDSGIQPSYTQLSTYSQQENGVVGVLPEVDSDEGVEEHSSAIGKLDADVRPHINLEFRELGLALKGSGLKILEGVTGKFLTGRITAIMGPSGAGKTTFLATILDKATYGIRTGQILLNGYERSLKALKPVIGFVPQEDVMHRDLTVDENLWISANYRLPVVLSRQEKLVYVERAVRVLGLEDVRHSCIGDEETRGISGGQRKRVNVGIELVIDPILLFCDEPTSGLDSTASKLVIRALHTVAQSSVTVAVVLHQPSSEIFQMFDDILLLGKGGRTVYMGPEGNVYSYFEQLGFSNPERKGSPEYLLDVIAGLETRDGLDWEQFDPLELFDLWELHCERAQESVVSSNPTSPCTSDSPSALRRSLSGEDGAAADRLTDLEGVEDVPLTGLRRVRHTLQVWWGILILVGSTQLWGFLEDIYEGVADALWRSRLRYTPGLLRQTLQIFVRSLRKRTRKPLTVMMDYGIFTFTGSVLGLVNPGRDLPYNITDTVYNIVAISLMTTVTSLQTFGGEQHIFWREASCGLNRTAFFIAKDLFDSFGTLVKPAMYLAMYFAFAQPRSNFSDYYYISAGIAYCCTGIGYLLSLTMEQSSAQLAASVISLLNALICTQTQMGNGQDMLSTVIYNTSFARWGLEGLVVAEAKKLQGVWLLTRCGALEMLNYNMNDFWGCLRMLIVLGVFFRTCAYGCLYVVNRDKMR